MKSIIKKNYVFAALTCFGILMIGILLTFKEAMSQVQAQILPVGIVMYSVIAATFWLRGINKLKFARLISENPILHISTAIISNLSGETMQQSDPDHTHVIVSYFGILLDDKIIKFNQDGIRLRVVEIGYDFISFTYGTEKRTQSIRLLRPTIDPVELNRIMEKFRYETGITPILLL